MREEYDFRGGRRGAIDPLPPGQTRITIRVDTDILDWFQAQVDAAGGGSYVTMISNALRDHVARRGEQLEDTIRRVVRDELRNTHPTPQPVGAAASE